MMHPEETEAFRILLDLLYASLLLAGPYLYDKYDTFLSSNESLQWIIKPEGVVETSKFVANWSEVQMTGEPQSLQMACEIKEYL